MMRGCVIWRGGLGCFEGKIRSRGELQRARRQIWRHLQSAKLRREDDNALLRSDSDPLPVFNHTGIYMGMIEREARVQASNKRLG